MAARFWVTGGTGNWNSTTNWSATSGGASGASVPGAGDTAALDASSGSGTVTLDISPDIQTLTCTGFTGTLAFGTNTISLNSTGTIFTGATTMTVTGTPLIISTYSSTLSRTVAAGAVTEANSISFRIAAGTGTFAVTTNNAVRDLDFTDGTNPTGFAGSYSSTNHTIYGSLKLSTGMTVTAAATTMTFAATSGVKTINTAGVTFDRGFTFNGVGGTWQLQAALTSGAARTCTLTNGTLDLASYTLTTGFFGTNNSNTRTLAFGSGKIVATGLSGTVYSASDSTNLTVTGSRRVEVTGVGVFGTTRSITGGLVSTGNGSAANAVDFFISAGADTINLGTASRVYRTLDFTGFSGETITNAAPQIYGSLILSSTMTVASSVNNWIFAATDAQTITTNGVPIDSNIRFDGVGGIWAMQDALTLGATRTLTMTNGTLQLQAGTTSTVGTFATSGTNQKVLQSTVPGSQATISASSGTFTVNYLTIQDNIATGGASWNATGATNVDAGNNTGWVFSPLPSVGNEITMRLRSFTQPRRF